MVGTTVTHMSRNGTVTKKTGDTTTSIISPRALSKHLMHTGHLTTLAGVYYIKGTFCHLMPPQAIKINKTRRYLNTLLFCMPSRVNTNGCDSANGNFLHTYI